jgi:hypothetical protein
VSNFCLDYPSAKSSRGSATAGRPCERLAAAAGTRSVRGANFSEDLSSARFGGMEDDPRTSYGQKGRSPYTQG